MKRSVARWLKTAAALLAIAAGAAAIVLVAGLVPIKASSGHWRLTHELLDFIKRRSVATHSLGTKIPDLDDPSLVVHGAGSYEINCRPCHGSPESSHLPSVPAAMTPPPPRLPEVVQTYDSQELFFIVKHGVKFTGMPAWPTQKRDDEVFAMVAFLLELPKLDGPAYRAMAKGTAAAGASWGELPEVPGAANAVKTSCTSCHGQDGNGRGLGAYPKIAGQKPEYLQRTLDAYAKNDRPSGAMGPIAAALSEGERAALAGYYASLSPGVAALDAGSGGDAERIRRGAAIAEHGIAEQGVPSCRDCHGPAPHARNSAYPNLAGQYAEYLLQQLQLFGAGVRGGSVYSHLMSHVATRLTQPQMEDVAAYYASLEPASQRDEPR